jgi:hypothetical protein
MNCPDALELALGDVDLGLAVLEGEMPQSQSVITNQDLIGLKELLENHLCELDQSSISTNASKNSGYEKEVCAILGMKLSRTRLADAVWGSYLVEFKKGGPLWINVVRIAEQYQATPFQDVVWIIFRVNRTAKRVNEIIVLTLSDLIGFFHMDDEFAAWAIRGRDWAKERGFESNNQWRIMSHDNLRKASRFVVTHPKYVCRVCPQAVVLPPPPPIEVGSSQ